MSGIVLLLPHGYEGQGPEHSSARLERFLQLAADRNIQVVNVTTPAQIFHVLRRQMHRRFRKPLVVMSPKSLLRHPRAVSTLDELADGGFRVVIDDPAVRDPASVRRLVLTTGKTFYTLDAGRGDGRGQDVAIIRVEQLYPFPSRDVSAALGRYPDTAELCWVQEEPANQGAWSFVRPLVAEVAGPSRAPRYIGRDEAASPATGNYHVHQEEEAALVERAFAARRPGERPVARGEAAG